MTVTPAPPPAPSSGSYTPQQGSYNLPPAAPPPQKSSGGCWKALAVGCGIIMVLGVAAIICLFVFVFSVIKRSDVYREAYTRSTNDPRVIAALGTPIERGWWVLGSVHLNNDTGTADIDFPISGPKGNARVHAAASRGSDAWKYSAIVVRPESGGPIDVLNPVPVPAPDSGGSAP